MQKLLILGTLLLGACSFQPLRSMDSSHPETIHAASTSAQPETDFNLRDYRWQHRMMLIFAPSDQSLPYQNQMQQWTGVTEAMRERNLKLVEIFTTGQSRIEHQPISRESGDRLRKQFSIDPNQFAIVLVGKDGSEKQRETTPTNPAVFFRTIDAMPMRQQEMHSNRE